MKKKKRLVDFLKRLPTKTLINGRRCMKRRGREKRKTCDESGKSQAKHEEV